MLDTFRMNLWYALRSSGTVEDSTLECLDIFASSGKAPTSIFFREYEPALILIWVFNENTERTFFEFALSHRQVTLEVSTYSYLYGCHGEHLIPTPDAHDLHMYLKTFEVETPYYTCPRDIRRGQHKTFREYHQKTPL